jgi:translation initiation factor IF-2
VAATCAGGGGLKKVADLLQALVWGIPPEHMAKSLEYDTERAADLEAKRLDREAKRLEREENAEREAKRAAERAVDLEAKRLGREANRLEREAKAEREAKRAAVLEAEYLEREAKRAAELEVERKERDAVVAAFMEPERVAERETWRMEGEAKCGLRKKTRRGGEAAGRCVHGEQASRRESRRSTRKA